MSAGILKEADAERGDREMPMRKMGDKLDGMGLEIYPGTWGRRVTRGIDMTWVPVLHRDLTISHRALSKEVLGPLCRLMWFVIREGWRLLRQGSGVCAEDACTMDSLEGSLAAYSCPPVSVPHRAMFPRLPQLYILDET